MAAEIRYVFALGLVMAASGPVRSEQPRPPHRSYEHIALGQKFVFVMITSRPPEIGDKSPNEEAVRNDRRIRERYERNGLYRNDGSKDPLWTVDWYADRVYVASDGVHLVRPGEWPTSSGDEAVSFFANGRLLRTYRIKDLVGHPDWLPHFGSLLQWTEDEKFDDARQRYRLTTKEGTVYEFDITTGEITYDGRANVWMLVLCAAGPLVAIAGVYLCCWLIWRRRRRVAEREAGASAAERDPRTARGLRRRRAGP